MGLSRDAVYLPSLLVTLADRELRYVARAAFRCFDGHAVTFLLGALRDETLPGPVRWEVPRVLAEVDEPEVAAGLLERLAGERDGLVAYRIIRALEHIGRGGRLRLDGQLLRASADEALASGLELMGWRRTLEAAAFGESRLRTRVHPLLARLLRDKTQHATERLVRLLGLMRPTEDYGRILRGVASSESRERASSHELLELLAPPALRPGLARLLDESERADATGAGLEGDLVETYGQVLRTLAEGPSRSVRELAEAQREILAAVGAERAHG